MKLHEYQSKNLFAKHGIPIPKGKVASTPERARSIAEELGGRVVVKSQVLIGGRGKAGGIKLAKNARDAEKLASNMLGMKIKGLIVRKVLVDEAVDIDNEIYLGITNDRSARNPVLMASSAGGVDIEEVAAKTPEKIVKIHIDPLLGLQNFQILNLAIGIELPRENWPQFNKITQGLWQTYKQYDATLVEINPLVITGERSLLALDGKMMIDDNALFRQQELEKDREREEEVDAETEAKVYGLTYIKLDGSIGCMVNGAGLAMATMDIIKHYGGEPANFLDIGGGADEKKVAAALRIILKDQNVKAVLINIFGGITRCDLVAKGILEAINELKPKVPLIVRLVGTNEEEGRELLRDSNLKTAESLADAAQLVVASS
ncbi:MAG: ADP-forming succinate--CoA ligase subunit beta [Anaerolineales bacterium]|jgi:succinyl-CoA synthetase beta subunit